MHGITHRVAGNNGLNLCGGAGNVNDARGSTITTGLCALDEDSNFLVDRSISLPVLRTPLQVELGSIVSQAHDLYSLTNPSGTSERCSSIHDQELFAHHLWGLEPKRNWASYKGSSRK